MAMNIRLRRTTLAAAAAALVAAFGSVHADSAAAAGEEHAATELSAVAIHANAGAGLPVEQRVREELSAVMMDLIQSGAFGSTSPQQISMDIDAPPQKVSNLGLLVDSKSGDKDGLHVLAVTPGGNAERMGLRAGDVLVALNGSPLDATDGAATLRNMVDGLPDGGKIAFDVRRDGRSETVSGSASSMTLPAMHLSIGNGTALASNDAAGSPAYGTPAPSMAAGCGRISDFDVAPRGQGLHEAKIINIDGQNPGPRGAKSYRVAAGPHEVKLSEHIESRYLSFNDRQRNAPMQGGYKTVHVDVAPDTTYMVAARLNEAQRDNPINGAYWDPVVWKETPESCR